MQAAAPLVLGVFHEQHAGAHPNMWDMVLAFGKAYPSAWHMVDMRKAVLPRLLAFLRSVLMIFADNVENSHASVCADDILVDAVWQSTCRRMKSRVCFVLCT